MVIYFYLEDDTVQVVESKQENSGIPQGTMIRRHRIHRPVPDDASYFTAHDFNVGREVQLYSKGFMITVWLFILQIPGLTIRVLDCIAYLVYTIPNLDRRFPMSGESSVLCPWVALYVCAPEHKTL